jgi:hypothetical protein
MRDAQNRGSQVVREDMARPVNPQVQQRLEEYNATRSARQAARMRKMHARLHGQPSPMTGNLLEDGSSDDRTSQEQSRRRRPPPPGEQQPPPAMDSDWTKQWDEYMSNYSDAYKPTTIKANTELDSDVMGGEDYNEMNEHFLVLSNNATIDNPITMLNLSGLKKQYNDRLRLTGSQPHPVPALPYRKQARSHNDRFEYVGDQKESNPSGFDDYY